MSAPQTLRPDRERPMLARDWQPDGQWCHCGGRLRTDTDWNGHAVQECARCYTRSSVRRIPAVALPAEPLNPDGPLDVRVRRCAGPDCQNIVAGKYKYCNACGTRAARDQRKHLRINVCTTPDCGTVTVGRREYCDACAVQRDAASKKRWNQQHQTGARRTIEVRHA